MNLLDCSVPVFGDHSFRGDCPKEEVEQATFFNWLRSTYPNSWGLIAYHPKNEQLLTGKQHVTMIKNKALGMTKGASDIIIPGSPAFVCEMKRRDHKKSKWQDGQIEYLEFCLKAGCFACVALGHEAAKKAFIQWIKNTETNC